MLMPILCNTGATMSRVRKIASKTAGHWVPTPPEIDESPELAILASLNCALEMTDCALVAAYRELFDDERREPLSPSAVCAAEILETTDRLRTSISKYRTAIRQEQKKQQRQHESDEVPF